MYSTTGTGAAYTASTGAIYDLAGAVAMYLTTNADVAITTGHWRDVHWCRRSVHG